MSGESGGSDKPGTEEWEGINQKWEVEGKLRRNLPILDTKALGTSPTPECILRREWSWSLEKPGGQNGGCFNRAGEVSLSQEHRMGLERDLPDILARFQWPHCEKPDLVGVWEIVTGSTWDVRMAWPMVQSVATLGSHNCHCLLGWGLGEGSGEETAWASGRRVGAAALKNKGTHWRWEETAALFLDVLNVDSLRKQPQE